MSLLAPVVSAAPERPFPGVMTTLDRERWLLAVKLVQYWSRPCFRLRACFHGYRFTSAFRSRAPGLCLRPVRGPLFSGSHGQPMRFAKMGPANGLLASSPSQSYRRCPPVNPFARSEQPPVLLKRSTK